MRVENEESERLLEERVIGASGEERRRAFRRKLPFGRGAVLVVGSRDHIVGLADLSVTGAYLRTQASVAVGETHRLRLMLLPSRHELGLDAEVVRVSHDGQESSDHTRGVAVRFVGLDDDATTQLRLFIGKDRRAAS